MRKHADRIAPNSTQDLWQVTADFFRSGENGQWREILDADGQARYERRVADLAPPDVAAWAHRA
jgi:aryl sulfotransferase